MKILNENNWYKDGNSDFAPVGYKCRMSLPSQLIRCQLYLEILLSVAIKCVPRNNEHPYLERLNYSQNVYRNLSVFSKYHKQPTSWRTDLLWKLLFSQLINKFSNFYVTRKIVSVFSRSLYCTLSSTLISSSSLCLGHANDLYLSVPRPKTCVHFTCPIFIYLFLIIHHPSYS
jgi:uncharacterized UBP type Zn finger protein